MEYFEGESLAERQERKGLLPWKEALDYGAQAAQGLRYAADRGLMVVKVDRSIRYPEHASLPQVGIDHDRVMRGIMRVAGSAAARLFYKHEVRTTPDDPRAVR